MDSIDTLIAARITKPPGIASGEVPVWNGSTWVRNSSALAFNFPGTELDYAQRTTPLTVNGAVGGQNVAITGNAVTYDGSTAIILEAYCPQVITGAADFVWFEVWDGATSQGILSIFGTAAAGVSLNGSVLARKKFTPTAGAHTYQLNVYRSAVNGTLNPGTGAAGANDPAYLRITKA